MSGQAKGSAPGGGAGPGGSAGGSSGGGKKDASQPSEGEYDIVAARNLPYPSGVFASICQLIKGALGAGILNSPMGYKNSGYLTGLILNFLMGAYMCYNLHIMVQAAQKLYRKLHIPSMSYPDLGEAAVKNHSSPKISRWSRLFRYWIDFCICLDLFGACTCYQIMVSSQIKQLVENEQNTTMKGKPLVNTRVGLLVCSSGDLKVQLYQFSKLHELFLLIALNCLNLLRLKVNRSGTRELIFKVFQRCLAECEAGRILWDLDDVYGRTASKTAGYPDLRIYLLAFMPLFIAISLLRHIQWLAPFSIVGNIFVLICVIATVYYSMKANPNFLNLVPTTSFSGTVSMMGMIVFSLSCAGIVLPVENNMKQPHKFPLTIFSGMSAIVLAIMTTAFFGYAGWIDSVHSPITLCFPMTTFPKILKVLIAVNVYATHGINFYAPYQLVFHYLKKLHPPEKEVRVDYIYRFITCVLITMLGVTFPDVGKLISFLGCFCLSNMAFIWPVLIQLLVDWDDPGFGPYKWRLIRSIVLMLAGIFLFIAGTIVSVNDLLNFYRKDPEKKHDDIFFYYAYMPPAPAEEE